MASSPPFAGTTLSPILMRSAKRSLLHAVPSMGPHALADIAVNGNFAWPGQSVIFRWREAVKPCAIA